MLETVTEGVVVYVAITKEMEKDGRNYCPICTLHLANYYRRKNIGLTLNKGEREKFLYANLLEVECGTK